MQKFSKFSEFVIGVVWPKKFWDPITDFQQNVPFVLFLMQEILRLFLFLSVFFQMGIYIISFLSLSLLVFPVLRIRMASVTFKKIEVIYYRYN